MPIANTHNVGGPDQFFQVVENEMLIRWAVIETLDIGMHFAEPHRILHINLIDEVFKLIIELQLVGLK